MFGFLVLHPDGPVLVDTGVGIGEQLIDELYSPVHHDLDEALVRHGLVLPGGVGRRQLRCGDAGRRRLGRGRRD